MMPDINLTQVFVLNDIAGLMLMLPALNVGPSKVVRNYFYRRDTTLCLC
jgi:hypothetical protein